MAFTHHYNQQGVLVPGNPQCQHHELVSTPAMNRHEVGQCRKCGRTIDYTVYRHEDRRYSREVWVMGYGNTS